MKNITIVFLILITLFSCKRDDIVVKALGNGTITFYTDSKGMNNSCGAIHIKLTPNISYPTSALPAPQSGLITEITTSPVCGNGEKTQVFEVVSGIYHYEAYDTCSNACTVYSNSWKGQIIVEDGDCILKHLQR